MEMVGLIKELLIFPLRNLFEPALNVVGARFGLWARRNLSNDEHSIYLTYSTLDKLLNDLHKSGYKYFVEHGTYLSDHNINLFIKSKSYKHLRQVADLWIQKSKVRNYAGSDVFFAGLEILLPHLNKKNLKDVYSKNIDNNQSNLWPFLEIVENQRPELLTSEMLGYLKNKQQEWGKLSNKKVGSGAN